MARAETDKHPHKHTHTDQGSSAGASAERLVEGWAAELQLFQVTVGNSDVSWQRQTLVEVLKHTYIKNSLGVNLAFNLTFLW